MNYLLLILAFIIPYSIVAQDLSGEELLNKSIEYHDPYNNWGKFNGTLSVTMDTPKASPRFSAIKIDLPNDFFYLKSRRDTQETTYAIEKGKCSTSIKDSTLMRRTPCETAVLYKNYYTYLYGLPMKLKDPGTQIEDEVVLKNFKGKEYLVLKVTYVETVGSDVWFFYFDPKSYAMEIYQFFKGDPASEGKDTGEYILLSEEQIINGIKMPKTRAWYYNKNDGYLGTDTLGE
ncbi:MAG: hypothetical protein KJO05_04750 [Bacteroidia bacterium]|nr:hypothetical protein [Bacteroidia bacterium]NNF30746.1 hypothetical protein [Flavobacteriaceae bacterium]MBT8277209.1 hypothetical protein [Bacteroidia bacterium]NNJ81460.1 hypothetical protein [Flavobacteriaceae bacterium]NNK54786.1 hypothetical protein [Flavobacteriaceae bacterium]